MSNDFVAVKGAWQVKAGLIPGHPIPEYSKEWVYDANQYQEDISGNLPRSHFISMMEQAHRYAQDITQPSIINWVKVEFIWL